MAAIDPLNSQTIVGIADGTTYTYPPYQPTATSIRNWIQIGGTTPAIPFDFRDNVKEQVKKDMITTQKIIEKHTQELADQQLYLKYLEHHQTIFKGSEVVVPFEDKVKWKENLKTLKGFGFES